VSPPPPRRAPAPRPAQLLVGTVPRPVLADAEVKDVPGEAEARGAARSLHRGGGRGRDGAVGGKAESKGVVAARAVAGIRGELRQQVELRHIELGRGGGFLHAALTVLCLVLD